jgi:hypothetical protein
LCAGISTFDVSRYVVASLTTGCQRLRPLAPWVAPQLRSAEGPLSIDLALASAWVTVATAVFLIVVAMNASPRR